MKVQPAAAEAFATKPPAAIRAALVFGPEAGLARERADALLRAIAGSLDDPFRVASLAPASTDRATLYDEAAAMAFGGGRRAVVVRDAPDAFAAALSGYLDDPAPGDSLVLVTAGELGPRSALRRLCEERDNAAALACYPEDGAARAQLLRALLAEAGLTADGDAVAALDASLASDRALMRSEIDKLALYLAPEKRITADAVAATIGDAREATEDELALAVAEGDIDSFERAFARLAEDGIGAVSLLRAVARFFDRLSLVAARVAAGRAPADAVASLRPPPFWKVKTRLESLARTARPQTLARAQDALLQAEADSKTTGLPDRTLTHRALLRIALAQRPR